jgi:xanthine dehydrogenase accessory factor
LVTEFDRAFEGLPIESGTFVVVATRGHNHDLDAVKAVLRTSAGYIGLLGSRRKKALLYKALEESGFSKEDISRVIIPVGMEIGSVTPEEISVSIMAQIVQKRRANGALRNSARSCGRLIHEDGDLKAASAARQ